MMNHEHGAGELMYLLEGEVEKPHLGCCMSCSANACAYGSSASVRQQVPYL
jgi:hypothetical protein